MIPQRIAIVGLGVAGGTAGMLLARAGHAVTVFEQAVEPGPVGAGVLLQPSGQMVLERLGLLEKARGASEEVHRLFARTHRNKTLVSLRYGDLPVGPALGIHRGKLFGILLEELRGSGASLRLGMRVVNYLVRPTHVRLFDEQASAVGDFDFLLATDGARSALRSASNIPHIAAEYPHGALWATGPCGAVRNHLLQITRGTKQLCGILPTGCGGGDKPQCSLFWSLRTSEREPFMKRGFEMWKAEVLSLCPESAEIFTELQSFEQTRFTNYMHVKMPVPHDDRCLFLGDSGHAMSPHLGQGINLALLDAFCFAHCAALSENFSGACRRYISLRRKHVWTYSTITYFLSPFFQSRGIGKAGLRNVFLPLMPKMPFMKKQMLLTMAGLRGNLWGTRLKLPETPVTSSPAAEA